MDPSRKIRKVITHEGRAVIVNLYNYLTEEYINTMMYKDCKCDLSHLRNIARRTADATNVTIKTVAEILKEDKQTNPGKKNKVYSFKKTKQSTKIAQNEKKLRRELELLEEAILAEAIEEVIMIEGKDNIEKILGPLEVREGINISENTLQPTEVKKEVEDEIDWELTIIKTEVEEGEVIWNEAEIETETEGEELILKEEEGTTLEDIDIKEESDDYEITIKEECIG